MQKNLQESNVSQTYRKGTSRRFPLSWPLSPPSVGMLFACAASVDNNHHVAGKDMCVGFLFQRLCPAAWLRRLRVYVGDFLPASLDAGRASVRSQIATSHVHMQDLIAGIRTSACSMPLDN
jgi:hypothetical protein